jgi:hypothetical protein
MPSEQEFICAVGLAEGFQVLSSCGISRLSKYLLEWVWEEKTAANYELAEGTGVEPA